MERRMAFTLTIMFVTLMFLPHIVSIWYDTHGLKSASLFMLPFIFLIYFGIKHGALGKIS